MPLVAVNALGVQPHVKGIKLKVLVVLSTNQSAIFPDVPTIWYGLVAPAAAPKVLVTRLHADAQKALQTKEKHNRMTQVDGKVLPGSLEMFAALIRSERLRYEKLVRQANIKPD